MSQTNHPVLDSVAKGRDILRTAEAAPLLNRSQHTLRKWACFGDGPIRPVRINGRLAWRVADIESLLVGS